MNTLGRLTRVCLVVGAVFSLPALAQMSTQEGHNQGMSLGQSELNRVGTSNINETNAQNNVPFYKSTPVQKNDSRTDANMFYDMGVGQINASRGYTAGNCDREGFNPEAEARKGMGDEKWSKMTTAQRLEATKNQQSFFDQECEGINFLAGEYPGRTEYEIPPGDDLDNWVPDQVPPDVPGECTTQTVHTPGTYDKFYCNESTSVEKRQCHRTANVSISYSEGLPEAPYTKTIYNHNSPEWNLTVHPAAGLITVHAPLGRLTTPEPVCREYGGKVRMYDPNWYGTYYVDGCVNPQGLQPAEYCQSWREEPYGSGNFTCYEPVVTLWGPQTEVISMYGGQTTIWQKFKAAERFRVRSRPNNSCVFRVDNWHYQGGAGPGPEDNHMTWTYNFCVPVKNLSVSWNDNCGGLEAATRR